MTVRHVFLITAGVATLGVLVYLMIAVNSSAVATSSKDGEPTKVAERARPERATKRSDDKPRRTTDKAQDANAPSADSAKPMAVAQGVKPGAAINIDKDEVMASANKAYDRGNMDEAIEIAKKVLEDDPGNTRMLRIMVSASCILDDATTAQKNYLLLGAGSDDRHVMRVRCERYGVKLSD